MADKDNFDEGIIGKDDDDLFGNENNGDDYQFTDDDDFDFDDQEFNFDDSNSDYQFSPEGDDPSEILDKFKGGEQKSLIFPIIFALIAIGVIAFGFVKLLHIIRGDKPALQFSQQTPKADPVTKAVPAKTVSQDTTSDPTTSPPMQQVVPGVTPEDPAIGGTDPNSPSVTDLQQRIDTLEKQVAAFSDKIDTLEQQNAQSTSQLNSLSRSMGNVQTQVAEVNNAINALLTAVKKQMAKPKPAQHVHPTTPTASHSTAMKSSTAQPTSLLSSNNQDRRFKPAKPMNYSVQAIIPGRAWLKDSESRVISVTQGDVVPGYGKVVSIDLRNGFVTTSSGAKFQYTLGQ